MTAAGYCSCCNQQLDRRGRNRFGLCRSCSAKRNTANLCKGRPRQDWCPPEYRHELRKLRWAKFPAAEAKKIILEQIAKEGRA